MKSSLRPFPSPPDRLRPTRAELAVTALVAICFIITIIALCLASCAAPDPSPPPPPIVLG